MSVFRLIVVAGGVVAIVGAPLAWAAADLPIVGAITLSGFDAHRPGIAVLGLGVAAVVLVAGSAVISTPLISVAAAAATFALGAAALGLALADLAELVGRRDLVEVWGFDTVETSVRVGLPLVIAGGGLIVLGSAMQLSHTLRRNKQGRLGRAAGAEDSP